MIPKIIHYCWFSKDKNKELPIIVQRSIESWKRILPDYQIMLWNEETFDINSVPWVKECYECGCASYAYIADYVRLYALYNYGGIYLDADQMVTKSLDPFLDNKMFVGMINQGEIGWGLIGAEKGNPIIKALLDKMGNKHYIKKDGSLNICNCIYSLTASVREIYNFSPDVNLLQKFDGLTIYPKMYFYPVDEFHPTEDTHAIHLGMTSHYKWISVVMPVYNGEKYLKECIDSVLAQTFTDFEFLIIDDGSTDSTESIIKSYKDDRVVYIKKEHGGISEALNLGIRRSIGLYIARMDADDMMYPDRLQIQYNVMESHPEYDMITAGFEWGNGKENKEYYTYNDTNIPFEWIKRGTNCIAHPTVMIRKSSLKKLPFVYESLYDGCEDLKLWCTMLTHGFKIHNIPNIVHYYRQHADQTTVSFNKYYQYDYKLDESIIRAYNAKNSSTAKLTVIIPFQNEGIEVERTVTSIRATAKDVNILLINDCSTDNYDYNRVAKIFDCDIINNSTNLGVANSRNLGVFRCKTPYFVLLDAHMRFYSLNWDVKLVELLEENNNRLITSNTIYFTKDENGLYNNEKGIIGRNKFGTYAAFVNMKESGWEYTAKWTDKLIDNNKPIVPVSCVLGAVYASSKKWWERIGGLLGLIKYGLDEPLMSIKTWLAGGEVLLIKDWGVGHLYRSGGNYHVDTACVDHNQLYLIHLFSPTDKIPVYEEHLKNRIGDEQFNRAKSMLMKDYSNLLNFKNYFFTKVAKHNFDYFLDINSKTSI